MFSIERGASGSPARSRARRLFSRTFSRARWHEYVRLLKATLSAGYEPVSLERFLDGDIPEPGRPLLILRHDVDQAPSAAITMANIEADFGLRSTWYFRWRTAHPAVIAELRRRGAEIGLHYETLSRDALDHGIPDASELPGRVAVARERLADEIAAFKRLFGPIRSVAPHGDTRVPSVRNADLLLDQDCASLGVAYDANSSIRRHRLAAWVTDRSIAEGGWAADLDPFALLRSGETPILCLTHPNNWVSGPSLWRDRLLSAALPARVGGTRTRVVRSGADEPPAVARKPDAGHTTADLTR